MVIKSYEDLEVWQIGMEIVEITPASENFDLSGKKLNNLCKSLRAKL